MIDAPPRPQPTPPFPIRTLRIGLAVLTLLLLASTLLTWTVGDHIKTLTKSQIEVLTAAEKVDHYGTVLELSIKAVVASGDPSAAARYRNMQPILRATLDGLKADLHGHESHASAAQVNRADLELISLELEALELASLGRLTEARKLIHSSRYDHLANVYYQGVLRIEQNATKYNAETRAKLDLYFWLVIGLSAASLVLVIMSWFALIGPTRKWGNELEIARLAAEDAAEQLLGEQIKLESLNRQFFDQARTDPLTGLQTRLKLDEDMAQLWPRVERHAESYCALMCDVDFFKQYNDTFGHLAGDNVLRQVSSAFRSVLRAGDQLYRFGGEEFLIILHKCGQVGGETCAEQVRAAVEGLDIPHSASPLGKVTVSIGMSCLDPTSSMTQQAWLRDADEAMYEAKGQGRNAVVAAPRLAA